MDGGAFDTTKQIGVLFTGVSVLFFVVGILLFFDPVLVLMANILFICGVCFIVGFQRVGLWPFFSSLFPCFCSHSFFVVFFSLIIKQEHSSSRKINGEGQSALQSDSLWSCCSSAQSSDCSLKPLVSSTSLAISSRCSLLLRGVCQFSAVFSQCLAWNSSLTV